MSTSMHEVFHWGPNTSAAPKKLSLSVAGSQIDFEGPPSPRRQTQSARNAARNRQSMVMVDNVKGETRLIDMRFGLVLLVYWCCAYHLLSLAYHYDYLGTGVMGLVAHHRMLG